VATVLAMRPVRGCGRITLHMAMKQAGGGRDDLVAFYVITQVYVFFFVVASSDC
jgi:hypothetical protein